ncbi:MAG: NYN domain-containing protein [Phycisphaerales bacterium]|nr:MAG: NYN domain-containing protein [Phycisphaerales bacterium]
MAGSCAVFIDGGYLDKVAFHDFGNQRLDYGELARELAAPDEMLRTYYYHCLPYRSSNPTPEERSRYSARHRFVRALHFLPRFEVRLGRLALRGRDQKGEPIFVQKRVDCMVGVDMALLAAKGRITSLALLRGDSDLIPAVEAVKQESVLVTLWHGSFAKETKPSRDLFEVCDERRQVSAELIARVALDKSS